VNSMSICNYVQFEGSWTIKNVDVAIIEMMKAQFEGGVRLWHNKNVTNPMHQDILNNKIRGEKMREVITELKIRKIVHSSISNEFGLTMDQVDDKCKSYGRFKAWLNSDVTRIKQVLNKVKENGVSPAFFASYERTEGYNSSWGWLNHTKVNGDPITDANSVSQWIVSQSKNTTDKPAWIDYANYKDFVPADIKQKGNADFANMKSGSIGKVIIAGTAAATWEVYYPNGLKKEFNGVQDYGAPINNMIITI